MKNIKLIFYLIPLLFISIDVSGFLYDLDSIKIDEDKTINNIPCKKGFVNFYADTKQIAFCTLSKNCIIQKIPCKKDNTIVFHKNGILETCILSKNFTYKMIPCKKDSSFKLHANGNIAYCKISESYTINKKTFDEGTSLIFNENNEIKYYGFATKETSNNDNNINNFCILKVEHIWYYSSGNLYNCVLSGDIIKNKKKFRIKYFLIFDIKGNVIQESYQQIHLASDNYENISNNKKIDDNKLNIDEDVPKEAFERLKKRVDNFGEDRLLIKFPNDYFYELDEDKIIQNIPCKKGEEVHFYSNDKLLSCTLSKDFVLNKIPCKKDTKLYLFKNGKIKSCTIYKDVEINSKKYIKDSTLHFTEDGKVSKVTVNANR